MFHVDNNSAVPVMPAVKPVVSAVTSFFTEGGNGVPPTYPGPDWFNIIQSELLAVLAAAGITPDKANNVQLLAAMRALFLDTSQNGADIQDKAAFLQNLGLSTFYHDSVTTWMTSPNNQFGLNVNNNGEWGCGNTNSPGFNPLSIRAGGTGATSATAARNNLGLGVGLPAIGIPFFWPSSAMPNTVMTEWSDMVFLKMNGATFSAATYPKLALVWPGLQLTECRGEFLRVWDDGRGVDSGRVLLSTQGDAIRNITGSISDVLTGSNFATAGAFKTTSTTAGNTNAGSITRNGSYLTFGAADAGVPVASENRPRNIAFNFLVRAK